MEFQPRTQFAPKRQERRWAQVPVFRTIKQLARYSPVYSAGRPSKRWLNCFHETDQLPSRWPRNQRIRALHLRRLHMNTVIVDEFKDSDKARGFAEELARKTGLPLRTLC